MHCLECWAHLWLNVFVLNIFLFILSPHLFLLLFLSFSLPPTTSRCHSLCPFLISYARRCAEAGFAGSGGRLGSVQEGAGFVCGPEARGSVPSGLENQHRPRGAAALQGFLLQGAVYGWTHIHTHMITRKYCMCTYKNMWANCTVKGSIYEIRKLTAPWMKPMSSWTKEPQFGAVPKNQSHNKWPD